MVARVDVDLRGREEVERLLSEFEGGKLNNRVRRGMRAGAKVMRSHVRKLAASDRYPRSFRKTKTKAHRNPLGVSTGPTSPLLNIFESGAGSHDIGSGGQLLTNRDEGLSGQMLTAVGRGGEDLFVARGPVSHPGMAARPLIAPTFDATKDAAGEAAADVIFEALK